MNITITRYEPVQVPVTLRDFPALERLTHFTAVQQGPERDYAIEIECQWREGARYGVDIPTLADPYDLAWLVREEVSGDWLAIPDDLPLWAGSEWTLAEVGPYLRRFVATHFTWFPARTDGGVRR